MQRINEDIKSGQFKRVYLLYGEEGYLRRQYRDKLKGALLAEGDSMNLARYEGKGVSVPEIIDLAETLPFLAERRVILIEDSGLLKGSEDALAAYLKEIPDTTCIVFVEEAVDKRTRLYKAVAKAGVAVECKRQEEAVLKRWLAGLLKKEGKRMTSATAELFLSKTGVDMENIAGELEKLVCYCMDKEEITPQDVEAVCVARVSNQIFAMIDAVAAGRQQEALRLYYDLLTLKEAPMRILFLIARQFNLLLQVKLLSGSGLDHKGIGEKTGLHGFIVGKYVAQAKKFSGGALRAAVEDCVEAEEAVKTGRLNDVLSVELLIIKCVS